MTLALGPSSSDPYVHSRTDQWNTGSARVVYGMPSTMSNPCRSTHRRVTVRRLVSLFASVMRRVLQ
jgi:hypothetical protein